jgi:thiol-disulfide isomerase/thioredoxin
VKEKIILVIAMAIVWSVPAEAAVGEGDLALPWQATNFQGESVSFPEFVNGKPTVIIFWASWCNYCKAFMPYLKEIQDEFGADSIEIVAVNIKEADAEEDSDPDAYIKNTGITLTAIRDGEDIAAAYGVRFVPGLMVVDSSGIVAYRRSRTKLPAGKTIAELWDEQVRTALDAEFIGGC